MTEQTGPVLETEIVTAQQAHGEITTSFLRQNDVATSF